MNRKVELHCHLDGVLDLTMAKAIRRRDPAFPVDPEAFAGAYPVNSFDSFSGWWSFSLDLRGDLDRYRPILSEHLERLIAQNVVYTELMVGGSEIPVDTAEALDKFRTPDIPPELLGNSADFGDMVRTKTCPLFVIAAI